MIFPLVSNNGNPCSPSFSAPTSTLLGWKFPFTVWRSAAVLLSFARADYDYFFGSAHIEVEGSQPLSCASRGRPINSLRVLKGVAAFTRYSSFPVITASFNSTSVATGPPHGFALSKTSLGLTNPTGHAQCWCRRIRQHHHPRTVESCDLLSLQMQRASVG
ncbi:MAG: hypothetical protein Ct9H300mP11_08360 [Chloroflexota bacterium]|nr:MAG: hypothetical protein Ct9H300mP11_08360 [Chloroflexota bacterium]